MGKITPMYLGHARAPRAYRMHDMDMFNAECNMHNGTGEYSCRCHGKRVISALSKLLKLKLAGHIL